MAFIIFTFLCVVSIISAFPRVPTDNHNFPIVDRLSWGALPSTDNRPLATPVPYVVIHHTYIPAACNTTETCAQAMRAMQTYHQSLSWGDIGYHFCVGSDGAAYEGRGWNHVGIHAAVANNVSVGICIIGDWRYELPPQRSLETTKALISSGVELGIIRGDYKLIGHRQATATECPGDALFNEIRTWGHFSDVILRKSVKG